MLQQLIPTSTPVYNAKILAPRQRAKTFPRPRLIELLHKHVPLRAQIISAPAGYGKTTLLVDFVNELDIPVCWYSLDISDRDPRTLLEGILASFRLRFPHFGKLTESRLFTMKDSMLDFSQLVATLTGEMYSEISDYFVLILEDYHFVEDSEPTKKMINLFLERVPENCHIIISSRMRVTLPALSKLMLQKVVATVEASSLSFTVDEVKELLSQQYGLRLSNEELNALTAGTDGWIVGILLGIESFRRARQKGYMPVVSQGDIFRYFVDEVYDREPRKVQDFLLASSTVETMEPEVCDYLLGTGTSQKTLRLVERRNLFVQCIDEERGCYRYHHLFREFLQRKLQEDSPQQFVLFHVKAASFFEQAKRWDEAITHFLTVRQYDEVARVIQAAGPDLIRCGKWATISKWFESLPREVWISKPELVLLEAESLIHLGQADEAARVLSQLLNQATDSRLWLEQAKALSWRSAAFRLTGHLAGAKEDIWASLRLLKQHGGPAHILGDAHRRLGTIYAEQGRFIAAKGHLRRALQSYTSIFDLGQAADVHNSLGIIYKRLGQLPQANVQFEKARQAWLKTGNLGLLASALNNIGIVYQRQGQYDLSLDTLRLGLEKAREVGYRRMEACILISMAEVLRDLEAYHEALALYQEGLDLARQVMEASFVAQAMAGIGQTYRLLGEREKARVLLKEALYQAEEQGQKYEATLFEAQLGVVEYEEGQYDSALKTLQVASHRLAEIGDKDALARVYFHLAQVSFLSKEFAVARSWLSRASELADELGYEDFLVVEGRKAIPLVQFAASKGIGGTRFARLLDAMMAQRNSRAREVKAPETPAPNIQAYALGRTRVLVNGRPIGDSEWRTAKARELFFYLLSCDTERTRDHVLAALWPDLPPGKGTSNFHINLYRMRRATFPGIVALEGGHYSLNPVFAIWFDVAEFEGLLSEANGLPAAGQARISSLEQAFQLYRGAFMPEVDSEWADNRRRELESKYLRALSGAVTYYAEKCQYGRAIELLRTIISLDPYQDEAYSQLVQLHLAEGDKVSALRICEQYLETVGAEIGCGLPPQLQQLRQRILGEGTHSVQRSLRS